MDTLSREQLLALIEIGIQAPSADNSQPWAFRLLPNGFDLGVDPKQMGKFYDVKVIGTQMTCGALIENVVRLASAEGLATAIRYLNCSFDPAAERIWVARLEFKQEGSTESAEATRQLILARHTNRFPYQHNKKPSEEILSSLLDEVQKSRDYRLFTYLDAPSKNRMIRTIALTDSIRFTHRQNHEEFYQSLRLGPNESLSHDGLAKETLGVGKAMIPALRMMRPWPLQRFVNLFGMHYFNAFVASWLPMRASSGIFSIVHRGAPDYYDFGRVMERFWLKANELGLSVQPLGALPLFMARLSLIDGKGFSPRQKKRISRYAKQFADLTPEFNPQTDQLVMSFRVGYANQVAPRSRRKPLNEMILDPGTMNQS